MKRKADEMQMSLATRATKWLGIFYTVSLLLWTIIDLIFNNQLGIQFIILLAGLILFFVSMMIMKQKVQ
ncbi:hypothetical protein MKX50_04765 [Paenibacillus sp. FSL W8-0186]|uniref:Uncharacterized protein n=1 Tax=Paenibacillus woosongensis TaxID=307580 RepID=A0ABQ4MX74_9BACL|nr:hypothetical protein [Paenibacillus woosongensis]GIP60537.1 hypothetical protein J15TS10_43510 [Paenibacillus woosongensis]